MLIDKTRNYNVQTSEPFWKVTIRPIVRNTHKHNCKLCKLSKPLVWTPRRKSGRFFRPRKSCCSIFPKPVLAAIGFKLQVAFLRCTNRQYCFVHFIGFSNEMMIHCSAGEFPRWPGRTHRRVSNRFLCSGPCKFSDV